MKEFLKKIKLIDHFTTEVPIGLNQFVERFKEQVEPGDVSFFSGMSDVFSSTKCEYKGRVTHERFRIKRIRRLFDVHMSMAIASGEFRSKGDSLVINTEIKGFHNLMIAFYIFISVFYLIFIAGISFTTFQGEGGSAIFFGVPFLLLHAAFMYGLPYFIMRRSTSRMKRELEREFFYMCKDE